MFSRVLITGAIGSACIAANLPAQAPAWVSAVRPIIVPKIDTTAVNMLDRANRILYAAQTLRGKVQITRAFKGKKVAGLKAVEIWASKPGSLRVNSGAALLDTNAVVSKLGTSLDSTKRDSGTADIFSMSGAVQTQDGVLIGGEAAEAFFASITSGSNGREVRMHTPERSAVYLDGKDTVRARGAREFAIDAAEYGLQAFFGFNKGGVGLWSSDRADDLLLRSLTYAGKQDWNGKSYDVVEWVYENAFLLPPDTIVYTTRFFIGGDSLVHRTVTTSSTGYQIDRMLDIRPGAAVSERAFSLPNRPITIIPHGEREGESLVGKPFIPLSSGATLLDAGSFTLNKALEGKKAVLLWLWSTGCSTCVEEFPIVEKWLRDLTPRGFGAVALDYAPGDEDRSRVTRSFNRATMPIAFGANSWTEFMINNGASFIVLDKTGKVVYQGGFDKDAIMTVAGKLL